MIFEKIKTDKNNVTIETVENDKNQWKTYEDYIFQLHQYQGANFNM